MKKALILGLFLMVFLSASVLANTYYVGDPSFEFPSINVQGTYTEDSIHHTYFACYSALDDETNVVSMSSTDTCELPRTFNPTEEEVGEHIYSTVIQYVSRKWTPSTGWQTVSQGIDNSQIYEFSVEYLIPEDDFNVVDWLNGLLESIQDFFCTHFELFCSSGGDDLSCTTDADCLGLQHACEIDESPVECINGMCSLGPVCPV